MPKDFFGQEKQWKKQGDPDANASGVNQSQGADDQDGDDGDDGDGGDGGDEDEEEDDGDYEVETNPWNIQSVQGMSMTTNMIAQC